MDTLIQVSGKGPGAGAAITSAAPTALSVDKAGDGVHTLTDLIVHEVSSVDVPANKRRWLLIKNAQGQVVERREIAVTIASAPSQVSYSDVLVPGDRRGTFKHAAQAVAAPPAPTPSAASVASEVEKSAGSGSDSDAAADTSTDIPTSTDSPSDSEAVSGELPAQPSSEETPAQEQATPVTTEKTDIDAPNSATVTDTPAQAAASSTTEPAAQAVVEQAKVETPAQAVVAPPAETPAPVAAATKVETPTQVAAPTQGQAAEIEVDEKTAEILSGAAGVMKAGRKLSAERKARLSRIAEDLKTFLDELEDKAAEADETGKAIKAMEASLAQRDRAIEALTSATDALKAQIDELRATSKGTGVVPTEKTAPPVSGQFGNTPTPTVTATKPAAVSWSELQTNLRKRKI